MRSKLTTHLKRPPNNKIIFIQIVCLLMFNKQGEQLATDINVAYLIEYIVYTVYIKQFAVFQNHSIAVLQYSRSQMSSNSVIGEPSILYTGITKTMEPPACNIYFQLCRFNNFGLSYLDGRFGSPPRLHHHGPANQ